MTEHEWRHLSGFSTSAVRTAHVLCNLRTRFLAPHLKTYSQNPGAHWSGATFRPLSHGVIRRQWPTVLRARLCVFRFPLVVHSSFFRVSIVQTSSFNGCCSAHIYRLIMYESYIWLHMNINRHIHTLILRKSLQSFLKPVG